jgi:hypothetical protein
MLALSSLVFLDDPNFADFTITLTNKEQQFGPVSEATHGSQASKFCAVCGLQRPYSGLLFASASKERLPIPVWQASAQSGCYYCTAIMDGCLAYLEKEGRYDHEHCVVSLQ